VEKRKCAAVNCNALEFRSVGYCNRHKDYFSPLEVINPKEISNDNDSSESDIRYDIDGNKNRISSKEINELLILLKSAKQYWVVDLGKDEDEFVQYAVNKGELEHWDNSEKIETKKMKMDDAFETLQSKLFGDFIGHTKWWDDEDNLEETQGKYKIIVIAVLTILLIIFSFVEDFDFIAFTAEIGSQAICGLIFLGGGGLTSLSRSKSGKFVK
tara:strand:- start:424 stop:1062 length:639 start_codon:yes stop_codon:yes gene_type:complete